MPRSSRERCSPTKARPHGDNLSARILSQGAREEFGEFGHLSLRRLDIARRGGGGDAGPDVIVQYLAFDPRQRRARRLELGQDVDAVATVVDHAGNAAHLSLDPAQAWELALVVGVSAVLAHIVRHNIHPAIAIIMTFSVNETKPSGTLLAPPTQAHLRSRLST